ncbi:LysR family transcriptional regulator [Paenarthrobacter ureafaciens]|nr:LysR family transcriptional regulator [Paenarthrobacter ureafaciens]
MFHFWLRVDRLNARMVTQSDRVSPPINVKDSFLLDVKKLRLLREVSLQGSITAAARSLHVTVSSVSQQIARLEHEHGIALLEASGRSVRLTPAAHMLVTHTETVLAALEEAEAELEQNRKAPRGVVHLVAFHTFAAGILGRAVQHLERIAPSMTLRFTQLDPAAAITELNARRADVVVTDEYPGYPLPPTRGIVRTELGTDAIRAYLPQAGVQPHAVAWAMEPPMSDATRWARGLCRGAGFEPRVLFESPDPYVHAQLVGQGVAAAFLPVMVARQIGLTKPECPLFDTDMSRTFVALVRRGTERSPAVEACRRALEMAYSAKHQV